MPIKRIFNKLLGSDTAHPPQEAYRTLRCLLRDDARTENLKALLKKYPKAGRWCRPGDLLPLEDALIWESPVRFKIAEALIAHDPSILQLTRKDNEGVTLFLEMAHRGHFDRLKFLAERGACLQDRDARGNSALHLAARRSDSSDSVTWLLKNGIPADIKNNAGETPLMICVEGNHKNIFDLLMEQQPCILNFRTDQKHHLLDARDNKGYTLLIHAARKASSPIIQKLLRCGADIEAKDKEGRTALVHALACDNLYAAHCLLQHGAKMEEAVKEFENFVWHVHEYGDPNADTEFKDLEEMGLLQLGRQPCKRFKRQI